jgi:hypothetical protein
MIGPLTVQQWCSVGILFCCAVAMVILSLEGDTQ